MTIVKLRPYQREAITKLREALASGRYAGKPEGPAIVLPTGTGKTEVFARFAAEWLDDHPGTRVLQLSHRTELVDQAHQKFSRAAPNRSVGKVAAKHNQASRHIVCASVQTLSGRGGQSRREMIRDVSLVIADECHHAPSSSWMEVLAHYAERGAAIIGVTATMVRSDKLALGKVWPDVVYSKPISEAIAEGYLVQPRGVRVKIADLDLGKVKKSGGDFNVGALGTALSESLAPRAIAKAAKEHAWGRSSVLFAPTKEVARLCHEALLEEGFSSAVIYDGMPAAERARIMRDARAGLIDVVCNCMIATEGTDVPRWSCAIIVRPTQSVGLFVQMVGRVLRPFDGKDDAIVLDVSGKGVNHKLISPIELFAEEAKMKIETDEAHLDDLGDLVLDLLGEEDEEIATTATPEGRDGPLESVEFDLFAESASSWSRTRGGSMFLSAGERFIVIVRGATPYSYSVVSVPSKTGVARWVIRDVPSKAHAILHAENDVTRFEKALAGRGKKWRKEGPSAPQLRWLVGSGQFKPGMTKGQAAELMDIAKASGRLDPIVDQFYGGAA